MSVHLETHTLKKAFYVTLQIEEYSTTFEYV